MDIIHPGDNAPDDLDILMESHYEPNFKGSHRGARGPSKSPDKKASGIK